ncbi:MAG: hypothetical protein H8K10_03660 [Nitrospira sp.]|nr:hypothetical protein [Nitrospira sp.]
MAHDAFERTAPDITCREVVDRTSAYLDEHVGDPIKVRLTMHLSSCIGCGTYVKQIASIRNLLGLLPGAVEEPARRDRLCRIFSARQQRLSSAT